MRQTLTLVGFAIGLAYGAPNLGLALGSFAGNLFDPQRIAAPKMGDVARQTSEEGVPCPLYAGTAGGAGNLIYCSEPDIVRGEFSSGKGGPQVQEPDRVYRTYAIRIGASLFYGPGNRAGLTGVSRIWENEKLVYDVTPTSVIMAESAKYAEGFTFYPGNDTQLPDPDIEAIEGVGNVPSYRGRAYIVFARKDLTDNRGGVPQYRFEVVAQGSEAPAEVVDMLLHSPNLGVGGGVAANWLQIYTGAADLDGFTAISATNPPSGGLGGPPSGVSRGRLFAEGRMIFDSGWLGQVADQADLNFQLMNIVRVRYTDLDTSEITDIDDPGQIAIIVNEINQGAIQGVGPIEQQYIATSTVGGLRFEAIQPYTIRAATFGSSIQIEREYPDPADVPEPYVALPELPGVLVGQNTGTTYFTPYAAAASVITPGTTTADDVTVAIGAICKMDASAFNVASIAGKLVRGLVIASQGYTGADALNAFRWVYAIDWLDSGGQIHAIPRGGAIKETIDSTELVDASEDADEDEELRSGDERRKAEAEIPLKVNLFFPDPITGYALTKATSPNFGARPLAVNEVSMEIPVVLTSDEAAQLADILEKVGDADAQGEVVRVLPERFAALTNTDCIHLTERGVTRRYRIDQDREGFGRKRVTMRYDRASNYSSNATQEPTTTPRPPPSGLAGSTLLVVMNSPGITDTDDRLGVRLAIGAVLAGWSGCTVQYRVAGTTAWTTGGSYTARSVMGALRSPLPYASRYVTDWVNTLQVQLFAAGELESLTLAELLTEGNGAAIIKPGGTVELLQYQSATNVTGNDWDLATLIRGRLATDPISHPAGSHFVTLDSTYFLELPAALLGEDLEFRAVTNGLPTESAPILPFTWVPPHSQYEFAPVDLVLDYDGTEFITGSFKPRARFGTDINPIHSINLMNWEVETQPADDGPQLGRLAITETEFTFNTLGLTRPITISVRGFNRITGAGASITKEFIQA